MNKFIKNKSIMNQGIIDKYKINFYNSVYEGPVTKIKDIDKIPSTNNKFLTTFLYSWSRSSDIDELLLPDIETVLNEEESELDNGSETIQITIYLDLVIFYPENSDSFSIPTVDFKEIIIAWRDFLLESPLNGTKV